MNSNLINYFLSGFVIVICLIWIYFFLFTEQFDNMPSMYRKVFLGILSFYALYRAYRLYLQIQKNKYTNNHDEH